VGTLHPGLLEMRESGWSLGETDLGKHRPREASEPTGAPRQPPARVLLTELARAWRCTSCAKVMPKGERVQITITMGEPKNGVFHLGCAPTTDVDRP
jgi:hypothetical protein